MNIKVKISEFKQKFLDKKVKSGIKISTKDKIAFLDQLSNLLNSGIPITNSFTIIMYQTKNKKLKTFVSETLKYLNKGEGLKEALARYKKIFTNFDISIIEMGEVTGKIGESIETIKNKEEKSRELKGKILGALIYPIVIICLSVGMIMVFMIYVIPKIQKMYKDAKVNLPDLTQAIINISDFLQKNILALCIGIVVFITALTIFKNHPKTRVYFDRAILKIPIFGSLIKKKILSLFTANLGILLKNGIIINEAITIASRSLENAYYEQELAKIIKGVSKGVDLSSLMGVDEIASGKEHPLFPVDLASVVKIGEQTGKMNEMLIKISIKYNKEIDEIVKNMQTAIEPIVIVGVGGIIGTIIMAIMLPFFNMVNVI